MGELFLGRISGRIEPPSKLNEVVHSALDEVCLKALDVNPDKRFPTCGEFAEALRRSAKRKSAKRRSAFWFFWR
jgi:hypothetical protein